MNALENTLSINFKMNPLGHSSVSCPQKVLHYLVYVYLVLVSGNCV